MPIIGGKHYPYNAKGMKAAVKARKKVHRTSAKSAANKLGF